VNPSGDYARDCQTGNDYAQLLQPHLKYNAGIVLLGHIVLDMIEAGDAKRDRGLVVGFMGELSRELSVTRSSLAIYAAASVDLRSDKRSLTARLKAGHATLRKITAKGGLRCSGMVSLCVHKRKIFNYDKKLGRNIQNVNIGLVQRTSTWEREPP
jgi:hypothetical protein